MMRLHQVELNQKGKRGGMGWTVPTVELGCKTDESAYQWMDRIGGKRSVGISNLGGAAGVD